MDLSVTLKGQTHDLKLKNPVLTASGTFGYGVEFAPYGDLAALGGIVVKGLSLKPREGNPCPRIVETTAGMLNAVGLQNDGVEVFCRDKLPHLPWRETPIIANMYATSPAEFGELAARLDGEEGVAALEVNVSCPNVKEGGVLFGQDPKLAAQGMSFMRGPLNPSANYTCGLLVDGFDLPPVIMMPWNPPYYAELLEGWHLRKEQDLFAYLIERDRLSPPDWLREEVGRLKAEARFTCRTSSKATLAADIRTMLDIYRESWAKNWGFSPLSDGEAEHHVKELKGILDPEFFVLFFHNDEPAAGMVALPDMNPLLKRLNGKLGLSALWHWWQAREEIRGGYRIMLFGIKEEFRLLGLPLLLLDYMLEKARNKPDFQWVEGSWVLEDNVAVDDLIEDFSGRITKRYRIYRREISV